MEARLQAGDLDRRITVQRYLAEAVDELGQPAPDWTTLASVWAKVERMGAREPFQEGQQAAWVDTRFTIRYRDDVDPKGNRILYDGRIWDIVGVQEIGRREGLQITAYARGE